MFVFDVLLAAEWIGGITLGGGIAYLCYLLVKRMSCARTKQPQTENELRAWIGSLMKPADVREREMRVTDMRDAAALIFNGETHNILSSFAIQGLFDAQHTKRIATSCSHILNAICAGLVLTKLPDEERGIVLRELKRIHSTYAASGFDDCYQPHPATQLVISAIAVIEAGEQLKRIREEYETHKH